jgi:hypothetical protein
MKPIDFYQREIEMYTMEIIDCQNKLVNENGFNTRWWLRKRITDNTQNIERLTKIIKERSKGE